MALIGTKGDTTPDLNNNGATVAMGGNIDTTNTVTNALDYTVYGAMGLEYSWNEMVFARFGTHIGHDTAGISLGGGLKYRGINLDGAYVNYGVLNETIQFGIGLEF